MNESRVNYTAARIAENIEAEAVEFVPAWTPVVGNKVELLKKDGITWEEKAVVNGKVEGLTAGDYIKARYEYDNVVIPQNDIPQLTAHMEGIELAAKARRIGIYYSQMAAFQAKTEMGIDLGEVLATQACGELSYEIDTEVVKMLCDNAKNYTDLEWNKRCPVGVSKRDHYAGFAEVIETGSQHIYDATQKHAANYMIASSSLKPVLVMMEGWKPASTSKINGPYFAGEINGIKVYVSPAIEAGKYVLGYNGGDLVTSAAVFAPYMAIVPTQLLGFADGAMSQGFSSLYDIKMLNPALLVAGKVVDTEFVSGVVKNTL